MKLRPKLLAYIFDILVKAVAIKPTLHLSDLPRMADFAVWGEAIARAMNYKDLQFLSVYYDNIGKQNTEAIDNSPLGQAIVKLINKEEGQCSWVGPLSKALDELNQIAIDNNLNTSKAWPKAPHTLSRRLKPLLSNLREGPGVNITITRNTAGDRKVRGTYRIIISPVIQQTDPSGNLGLDADSLEVSKLPSPSSPSSPDQNHEGNEDKNGEGLSGGEDIYLYQDLISSPKTPQNHVQNSNGEDSEGSEGICDTEGVQQGSRGLGLGQVQGNSYSFKRYSPACEFQTDSEREYEKHGALKHLENPLLYPSRYEIEKYGLKPQGKEWEV